MSGLLSTSGVNAKASEERIAIQAAGRISEGIVFQAGCTPHAFRQDQSRSETCGGDVARRQSELALKGIREPL